MPSVEELEHCPKCGSVGKLVNMAPQHDGSVIRSYNCQNKVCLWYDTGWAIQVQSNGKVAEPEVGPKLFEVNEFQKRAEERAVENVEAIMQQGEIKNPY